MPTSEPTPKPSLSKTQVIQRRIIIGIAGLIVILAGIGSWIYATTPTAIRNASQTHFHLRLQILVDGKAENFAQGKYQTPFNKDICTAALTSEPVHFHDGKDQFLHIHWAGITGGILLKDYGWNLIGGPDGYLGFELSPSKRLVPIHGLVLPPVKSGDNYYLYTGDDTAYHERNWQDFLHQDLSGFMAGKTAQTSSLLPWLIPTASAHGDDEKLAKLNDFRGNIVIFAQKDKPSGQQVKARFADLQPLPDSACSG